MTERFVSANLDLSRLPPPQVVQAVDYEAILAARMADLKARLTAAGIAYDVDTLETDPAGILQQEDAYREALDLAAINDAARSVMLAFAIDGNLDNLAAFYGVERLTITPANPSTGAAAVMESNDDLRVRVTLAPEALPYAGMTGGGYRSLALLTASSVKDVTTIKRSGGRVDVILLGRTGDGTVGTDVVNSVAKVFLDDSATQLTDVVAVRSVAPVNYTVAIKLLIPIGPDPAVVRAAAQAAVQTYADARHRAGLTVYANGLLAAAKVGGVENAVPVGSLVDLIPAADQTYYCTGITISSEAV